MFKDLKPYDETSRAGVSWLGDAPRHWQVLPGAGVLRLVTARNRELREQVVLSLSYGRVVVKPNEKLRGLVPASFETYQVLEPGNIVVRPTDLQNDQTSVRVGLVKDRGMITSAYLGFAARAGVSPEFVYHYLTSLDAKKVFYGMGSGLRQNLEWSDFRRLPVLQPPADEQAAIVKYLAHAHHRIDRAIAAKRQLIALLEEQKQAIINQAVTRGLDPTAPFEATGSRWFPQLPESWHLTSLGRNIHFAIDGPHFSPNYVDEGLPFLSARNIRPGTIRLEGAKFISRADYETFGRRVQPRVGDVLYTKGGTTGVAAAVDHDFEFQVWVHVAVLRVKTDLVDPRFLASALNSTRGFEQAQLETRGATNQDLGLSRMKRIELPLPPLAEQRAIVAHIDSEGARADAAIESGHREIGLLREFRTRLTSDVVTGQVDVRRIAASLPDLGPSEVAPDVSGLDDDLVDEAAEFLEDVDL